MSGGKDWRLQVDGTFLAKPLAFTYEEFERMADPDLLLAPYVQDETAEAVSFHKFMEKVKPFWEGEEPPTHVVFHAADQFMAEVQFHELTSAFLLFKQNGEPLKKGFPVRVYVPDGSSNCLNVKSVVRVELRKYEGEEAAKPSSFGFKNTFSPEELRKKATVE
ncbi:hypothetical protein BSNK01_26990 [Bacillaceae bacterium]